MSHSIHRPIISPPLHFTAHQSRSYSWPAIAVPTSLPTWLGGSKNPAPTDTPTPTDLEKVFEDNFKPITSAANTSEPLASPEPLLSDVPSALSEKVEGVVNAVTGYTDELVPFRHEIGDFYEAGLGGFGPIRSLQTLFEYVHVYCGLPWWVTVAAVTFSVRLLLFPIILKNLRAASVNKAIQPEVAKLREEMMIYQAAGDQIAAVAKQKEMTQFMKSKGVNPFQLIGFIIINFAVLISIFQAVFGIMNSPIPGISTEGLAWFRDLGRSDPYFLLPAIGTAITIANISLIGQDGNPTVFKGYMSAMPILGLVATVFFLPVIAGFSIPSFVPFIGGYEKEGWPAGVFVYFVTSNFFTMCQGLTLRVPGVRSYLRLPPRLPPQGPRTPKEVWAEFKKTWQEYNAAQKATFMKGREEQLAQARATQKSQPQLKKKSIWDTTPPTSKPAAKPRPLPTVPDEPTVSPMTSAWLAKNASSSSTTATSTPPTPDPFSNAKRLADEQQARARKTVSKPPPVSKFVSRVKK